MSKLIFIVDDNDSNLTMAALALENDFRVMTMASAAKMLSILEKKRPDLILLDIEMPEMNGFEAIAKLKEHTDWSAIPVIFLTGHNEASVSAKGKDAGAVDVLPKPIVAAVLLEAVKRVVGE